MIAYDRLGFGKSTARDKLPTPNFIDEETQIVNRLLDHFEAPHAVLFGYSVGGSMALSAAAQIPNRIIAVISESAQVFVEDHTLAGVAAARLKFGNPEAVDKLRRWHGDKVEWILRAWFDVWTAPNFRDWSLKPILPNIECPLLVIHGDLDEFGTLAFPETIAQLAGGRTKKVILENCGHIPHWEREDIVLEESASHLDDLS